MGIAVNKEALLNRLPLWAHWGALGDSVDHVSQLPTQEAREYLLLHQTCQASVEDCLQRRLISRHFRTATWAANSTP